MGIESFGKKKLNIELFPCAGGMAKGFRDEGFEFDLAVELMPDHCTSYEKNLGHRPMNMDARDLLRMLEMGVVQFECAMLVADPPCTPWSHAGKRKGVVDERDMVVQTCKIIEALRPDVYLIGNVPGLDDSKNLPIVQKYIGGLSRLGYCTADFARLNAASFGVPQHRWRPFWFGHRLGTPCIQWPEPTHGDPALFASAQGLLPMVQALKPWVSCRQALCHLSSADLGRAVKVSGRKMRGEKRDREAMQNQITVVGEDHAMSSPDAPARTLTKNTHSDGSVIVFNRKHKPADEDAPAGTIRGGGAGHSAPQTVIQLNSKHKPATPDAPSPTLGAKQRGQSGNVLMFEQRSIEIDERHPPSDMDAPAMTIRGSDGGGSRRAIVDTAPSLVLSDAVPSKKKRGGSTQGAQSQRVGDPDRPSTTVQAREDRVGTGSIVLEWPWNRPSTTVTSRPGLPPPGHHDEDFAIYSLPDAVIISELAAAILQGFPETWIFHGKTKKARWSQIGQAMPPPMASAVARQMKKQMAYAVILDVAVDGKAKKPGRKAKVSA